MLSWKETSSIYKWCEIRVTCKLPKRRAHHACISIGDKMIIYGGVDTRDGFCEANILWSMTPLAPNPEWQCLAMIDQLHILPKGICRHQMIHLSNGNEIMVIGGLRRKFQRRFSIKDRVNQSGQSLQQNQINNHLIFKICLNNNMVVPYSLNTQNKDSVVSVESIDSHTAVYSQSQNSIVIFGGYINNANLSNETYILNLNQNKLQNINEQIKGSLPSERCDHTATIYEEKLFISGGKNLELNIQFDDLWMLDLSNNTWSEIIFGSQQCHPPARFGHAMTIDQDHGKIYIFGGSCLTQTQELNDFYVYDIQTQKWELLHNSRISQSTNKSPMKNNQKDLKMINRKFTSQLSFKVNSQPLTPLRRLSDNKYQRDKFFEQPHLDNVIHEAVKQNMMFFKSPNNSSQRNSNIIINQGTPIPLISPKSGQESDNDLMTVAAKFDENSKNKEKESQITNKV
eukprot:403347073